jgi:hypothetical protein
MEHSANSHARHCACTAATTLFGPRLENTHASMALRAACTLLITRAPCIHNNHGSVCRVLTRIARHHFLAHTMAAACNQSRAVVGAGMLGRDFTTSPEISQVFGELVGVWHVAQWVSIHLTRLTSSAHVAVLSSPPAERQQLIAAWAQSVAPRLLASLVAFVTHGVALSITELALATRHTAVCCCSRRNIPMLLLLLLTLSRRGVCNLAHAGRCGCPATCAVD